MPSTTAQFEVEQTIEANGRAYVVARLLDSSADFTLTESSSLDGCKIEKWTDIPRAHTPDGKQRYDLFSFCLKSTADRARFTRGKRVTLEA